MLVVNDHAALTVGALVEWRPSISSNLLMTWSYPRFDLSLIPAVYIRPKGRQGIVVITWLVRDDRVVDVLQ